MRINLIAFSGAGETLDRSFDQSFSLAVAGFR
jgi:hypothetical protein